MGQLRVKWIGMNKPYCVAPALLVCVSALGFAQQKSPTADVLLAAVSSPATITTEE